MAKCQEHTGIESRIGSLERGFDCCKRSLKEKVSMKVFYLLIIVLITVFGGIFLLQYDTNNDINELIKSHTALAQDVKHLNGLP